MVKFAVFVSVLVATLFVKEGESVRCWTCSSDLDPLCHDPFNPGRPENTFRYTLTNCDANVGPSYPYLSTSKTVCKKDKKYVNGQLVVTRGCSWKRADDYSYTCPNTANARYESTLFCETCEHDSCNSATTIGKTLALLIAPLGLLLFK